MEGCDGCSPRGYKIECRTGGGSQGGSICAVWTGGLLP